MYVVFGRSDRLLRIVFQIVDIDLLWFFYLVPLCPRIHLFLIWDREKVAGWHKAGCGQEGAADGHTILV